MKKVVSIGLLGSTLDQGFDGKRWNKWRPSVCLCQQENLLISRYHLIYQKKYQRLCDMVIADIASVSPETKVIPHLIEFNDPWDFEEVYEQLFNFVSGLRYDSGKEEYIFHITTGTHVAQICIFLLTESRRFPGKLVQTSPAKDPCGTHTIIDLDLSKYDRIAERFRQEVSNDISFLKNGIDTRNAAFNRLIERIEQVALRTEDPVLLTGPTGAGKSLLAERIYDLKKIRGLVKGKFVEVNCATIRGDAAMSALFGHRKGSFTGATADRPGLLKAADQGIIFLDEIGELGLDEQAMLLRAIEVKRFIPLGSDKEETSSFQLICGTNRDLRRSVSEGTFREDLLARINLWTFQLPGLRNRIEDIEPNIEYELKRFEEKTSRRIAFNREAYDAFISFAKDRGTPWKANFRDLNAAITRMAVLCSEGRISKPLVEEEIIRLKENWNEESSDVKDDSILNNHLSEEQLSRLDLFDRVQLSEVLRITRKCDSLSHAGRILFSVSRNEKNTTNDTDRLRKYLARFGLSWQEIKETSR